MLQQLGENAGTFPNRDGAMAMLGANKSSNDAGVAIKATLLGTLIRQTRYGGQLD